MSLAWACLVAVAFAAGCSSSSDAEFAGAPQAGKPPAPGSGILYEGESPLTLAPGERARLSFLVTPRGKHAVRFGMRGDSGDASLDTDIATTSEDGRISVELKAPSSSRTFTLRASLDGGSAAEVPVSVSGLGFGNIEVVPSYGGKRAISRWTGTVATGTSCAELLGIPPADGPLVSHAFAPRHPIVKAAPVGPALVVTARAGHFAGGCVDVKGLGVGETKEVTVPLLDRPLDLSRSQLSIQLGFEPEDEGLEKLFTSAIEASTRAFVPGADAASLLDSMRDALLSEQQATFDEARMEQGWDERVVGYLEAKELSLSALVRELLAAGSRSLDLPSGLVGSLLPEGVPETASFHPASLFGIPASSAAMPSEASMAWSSAPLDSVHLGGDFVFSPSALLSQAALSAVRELVPDAASVEGALASLVSCEELAIELFDETFPGCDAICLANACENALAAMWKRTADRGALASFTVTASGEAKVGNEAEITSFEGSWVGSITQNELVISVKGKAMGR